VHAQVSSGARHRAAALPPLSAYVVCVGRYPEFSGKEQPVSQYARRDGVMSVELEGETVLLDTLSGQYFRLNSTGTLVWTLLERACSIDELAEQFSAEVEVDAGELRRDLTELLESLQEQQLVVTS
jgi:hypothetical protein